MKTFKENKKYGKHLSEILAIRCSISKKNAEILLKEVIDVIREELAEGNEVNLKNFGTFYIRESTPRPRYNISTGETVVDQPRKHIRFKPSVSLKAEFRLNDATKFDKNTVNYFNTDNKE